MLELVRELVAPKRTTIQHIYKECVAEERTKMLEIIRELISRAKENNHPTYIQTMRRRRANKQQTESIVESTEHPRPMHMPCRSTGQHDVNANHPHPSVKTVSAVNDGPITILLRSEKRRED